ncbi:MAG TPA: ABC transporter permease [Natronosporangium sp.]
MAYDNSYGRHEAEPTERMGLAGFRSSAPYESSYQSRYGDNDPSPTVPAAELSDVFDDPDAGEPGRDRLAIHWTWEALLLIGVGVLGYLLMQADSDALRGDSLRAMLVYATGFGLLGIAAGVSLRAGVPNLAIGPVAAAAGAYFALRGDEGVATPTIFAVGVAVLLGLAVSVLVMTFHVPGWAASLAAGAAAVVWLQTQDPTIPLAGGYNPSGQAAFLFALVAAVGILGGLLGTLRTVRRSVGRFRPIADPARRRGAMAALVSSGALVLSMAIAPVAGVLLVAGMQQPAQGSTGVYWLEWTLIGFGVALVGGTSVFGRRGGVFGTTLAVIALVLFDRYQEAKGWDIALLASAAVAVAGGLVVSRLIETFGRPAGGEVEPESASTWETTTPASADGRASDGATATGADSWSSGTDSWSSALPARPAPSGGPDPWDDDRWTRR